MAEDSELVRADEVELDGALVMDLRGLTVYIGEADGGDVLVVRDECTVVVLHPGGINAREAVRGAQRLAVEALTLAASLRTQRRG